VIKGKTLSKHIINGSGQMPTLCELPDPKVGTWKVTLVVDHKENGKKGAPLKVGQNCAVVQGLQYEVRGAKVEKADIECSNGVIHVIDSVMIPDVKCVPPRLLCSLRGSRAASSLSHARALLAGTAEFKCCGAHAALMRADALFNTNSLQQPRVVSSAWQHRCTMRAA